MSTYEQGARQRVPLVRLHSFEPTAVRSLLTSFPFQVQCGRIHAIPQTSRGWAILEHVSQMRVALRAAHLRPPHAVGGVGMLDHFALIRRLKETWPARARVELRLGIKQRLTAADTVIHPAVFRLPILPGEGGLGASLPRYVILLRREFLFHFALILLYF